jgi:serine/threonine protein kinase
LNWTATDEVVAIKRVKWQHIRASQNRLSEDFINEIAALKYLSDFLDGDGMDAHILTADIVMSDESYLYLVMPYCAGGDICTLVYLREHRRFPEDEARTYFLQLLKVSASRQIYSSVRAPQKHADSVFQ